MYTTFTGLPFCIVLSIILIGSGYSKLLDNMQNRSQEMLEQAVWLLLVGCVGTLNQITFNLALKNDDIFKISLVKTADLFFVLLLQTVFLGINVNTLNLVGVAMIFSSTLFILCFKFVDEMYQEKLEKASNESTRSAVSTDGEDGRLNSTSKPSMFFRVLFFKF